MPTACAPPPLVVAIAYDGLCTFEFACAVEVFALPRPEMGPDWYRFAVAAAAPGPIRGLGGVEVQPDGGLELLTRAHTIIVPGWPSPRTPAPAALVQALQNAHGRGAFVLAATGLLSARRATTHWRHSGALAEAYPDIDVRPDVLYVDEGSILTSAGSAAGLDLCLHLVRRDFGAKAANQIARRLVVPAHRDCGQAQYVERPAPQRPSARLSVILDRMRTRLAESWPIERVAAEAGMSVRGVHRHFRAATGLAPGAWLIAERIARARELLEETALPVEEIKRVGGVAVAVASDEARRCGVDAWKRQRLLEAGADVVIPDYRQQEALLEWLFQPLAA